MQDEGTQPEGAATPLPDDGETRPAAARDPGQPPGTVPVTVIGVRVEMPSNSPIVLMKEAQGDRYLPIWIGAVEATAIAFAHQGVKSLRPLTHDLFADVLEAAGLQLLNVTISHLEDGIFYSSLSLSNGTTVSARPSDAIALAMRMEATILASTEVLDQVGVAIPEDAVGIPDDAVGIPDDAADIPDDVDP